MPRTPEPTRIIPPYSETISGEDHSLLINLDADDHPQYHNDARALTWISTITGSVVQAFDQALQDIADLTPNTDDVLQWNGSNWTAVPDSTIGITDHTGLSNLAWTSSGHTGGTNQLAYFGGAGAASGSASLTFDGTATRTPELEISATGEGILFTDTTTTGKYINFNTGGFADPSFTARSSGTRIILWPSLSASTGDWAIGLSSGHIWHSTPENIASQGFRWFGGETDIMHLDADGDLTLFGTLQIPSTDALEFGGTTSYITGNASGHIDIHSADNIRFYSGGGLLGNIHADGGLVLVETLNGPVASAGRGSYWVKNDVPTTPYFTDDTGAEHQLAYTSGAGVDHTGLTNLAWTSSAHTGSTNAFAYFDGSGNPATTANITTDGTDINLTADGAQLNFTNTGSTGKWIFMETGGIGAPTFTTRSSGTKWVVWDQVTATTTDYAIGLETGHMWFGAGNNTSAQGFKWYGKTTEYMSLALGSPSELSIQGVLTLAEQAASTSVSAGYGQFWVRNDAPSVPMFTDDTGTDYVLNTAGGGGDVTAAANLTDNAVIRGDGGTKGVQDSGILIDDSDNMTGITSLTLTEQASAPVTPAAGDATFWVNQASSTNLPYFTDDNALDQALVRSVWLERSMPASNGDSVELGSITGMNRGETLGIFVVGDSTTSGDYVAYHRIAVQQTASTSTTYYISRPLTSSGPANGSAFNDVVQIEINRDLSTLNIRARSYIGIAATCYFRIVFDGYEDSVFTASSTQATTTAPTDHLANTYFSQLSQLGNNGYGNVAWEPLYLQEKSASNNYQGGFGQLWVRDNTPNRLMWRNDSATGTTEWPVAMGPDSSTDNGVPRWDGSTGYLLQTTGLTISDNDDLQGLRGLEFNEAASVPFSPGAGDGLFWVRNDTPNTPMFTDDAGTDHSLYDIVYDTSPQLGGNLDANGKAITYDLNSLTSAAGVTIDWNLGNKATITMDQDVTYTFTAPTTGACSLQLIMKQDPTGGWTPTWPASVKWPAGTEPTWSAGANEIDIVSFLYDGTNYYAAGAIAFS